MDDAAHDRPRWVPLSVPLAGVLAWDWRESFAVLMVLAIGVGLWIRVPELIPLVLLALLSGCVSVRARRIAAWMRVLRWARVADVVTVDTASAGAVTRRISHARGWNVQRRWYTGEILVSTVRYTVEGEHGYVSVRGLEYADGVIVASSKDPSTALCISDFPCDLRLDGRGRWTASLPRGFWGGGAATAAMYLLLVAGIWFTLVSTTAP